MTDELQVQQENISENKGVVGCLLVALVVATLVSGLFVIAGFFALVHGLVAPPTLEEIEAGTATTSMPWWSAIPILVFSLPMFVLFARGIVVCINILRGRPKGRLVTVGLAWMLAAAYGVPCAAAFVWALFSRPEGVSAYNMIWAPFGLLILLAGPFVLSRIQKKSADSNER